MKNKIIIIITLILIFSLVVVLNFNNKKTDQLILNDEINNYILADNSINESENNNQNQIVKSPETGIKDYYLTLGIAILILGIVVAKLQKKNIFKKI